MQAAQQARRSAQASPAPAPARTPLTVEEVEAEMMRKAHAARQAQMQQGQQPAHATHAMARQGSRDQGAMQAIAQQAQMTSMRQQHVNMEQGMPPLPLQGQQFPPAQAIQQQRPAAQGDNLLAQLLAATPQGQQMQQAGISLHEPQIQQTMEDRMRANAAMEEARRRKAAKIHRMAKYNGVMTQGDKDFITRIQVSQLINSNGPNGTHDPYSDDFYFAVIQSMRQGRLAAMQQANAQMPAPGGPQQGQGQPLAPIQPGQQGRNRNNAAEKRMTRRENAMNRMTQQVQRLVDDAKKKPRASNCRSLSFVYPSEKADSRSRQCPWTELWARLPSERAQLPDLCYKSITSAILCNLWMKRSHSPPLILLDLWPPRFPLARAQSTALRSPARRRSLLSNISTILCSRRNKLVVLLLYLSLQHKLKTQQSKPVSQSLTMPAMLCRSKRRYTRNSWRKCGRDSRSWNLSTSPHRILSFRSCPLLRARSCCRESCVI